MKIKKLIVISILISVFLLSTATVQAWRVGDEDIFFERLNEKDININPVMEFESDNKIIVRNEGEENRIFKFMSLVDSELVILEPGESRTYKNSPSYEIWYYESLDSEDVKFGGHLYYDYLLQEADFVRVN